MTQQHKDPPAVAGVHLVKTTSREEDSLASDVVDIMQAGLRGSTDTDQGAVEETYLTTLEKDEARRTEQEFFQALARRVKEFCPWADGKRGLECADLNTHDGWRFGVYDRDGRLFSVEISFSHIFQVAQKQRKSTLGNFHATLDSVCEKLRDERTRYMSKLQQASAEIH